MKTKGVTCDKCKENFIIDKIDVEKMDKGIERTYFKCPHCNTEYTSYYTNVLIRKKQKEIRERWVKYGQSKTEEQSRLRYEKIEKLKKIIKELMQELKKEIESTY